MKAPWLASLAAALLGPAAVEGNPLAKVFELMDNLSAKIKHEGEEEAKAYKEYEAWCTETIRNTGFEIETSTSQKSKLEARINELTSDIQVAESKIEDLASAVATNSNELKEATAIRDKEMADFLAAEKELRDVVDSLSRAHGILQREMQKKGGSFAQMDRSSVRKVLQMLTTVVEAAGFDTQDRTRLIALVQAQDSAEADDYVSGAPSAAAYESHSSGILDLIDDLKDKAEEQLSSLRKTETNAQHSYNMLKQSLETQTNTDQRDLDQRKSDKAQALGDKASAEGDLERTTRDLQAAQEKLESTKLNCARAAQDHDDTVKARDEELKVIAEAKEVLSTSTSGAEEHTYSFVQVSSKASAQVQSRAELVKSEVVTIVKRLAEKHHSSALAQLASRISAVVRFGAGNGEDPFAKIKDLINDLIARLKQEALNEATEKAYCDEEMKKTQAKKDQLSDKASKLAAKLDQSTSRSEDLKAQIAGIQQELAELTKEQAELDKLRQDGHAAYVKAKADLEQGLTGVRRALGMLRDYYGASLVQTGQPALPEGHSKAEGAGAGILGILEVVESDFSKSLVKEETQESDAQTEYAKTTQQNKVTVESKNKDVTYKQQELAELEKTITEVSQDHDSTNAELDAVLEYWGKLQERCVAKPETYEERASRRQAEINGLKQALDVLENEAAFAQRGARGRRFRGKLAPQ